MFFRKKDVIGLDIGSGSLKLAELKKSGKGYQLKNVGEVVLPSYSIVEKIIKNSDAVADSLSQLITESGTKNKNVAISVSGHSVIIKTLRLAPMPEDELAESIPWELEQYVTQGVENVNYDYQVLPGETPEGEVDVLVVAARKDVTDDYVSVVRNVGLNPVIVDTDVFALGNMYELNYEDVSGVAALINIGASFTNINILKDGIPVFTRGIAMGGNELTESIMKEQNLSFEDAELAKQRINIQEMPFELERLINDYINHITGELKRNIDLFSAHFSQEKISRIILSGGSSKVFNIDTALQDVVGVDVDLANPFKNVFVSGSEFDSGYIADIATKMDVALGLAIRAIGDS